MTAVRLMAERAYQRTDLQSNYSQVVEDARAGGALIRDKDGMTLLLAPAGDIARAHELRDLFVAYIQLQHALRKPRDQRDVSDFGRLAFAAILDDDDLAEFAHELADGLLLVASGGPFRVVGDLLYDWQATAEVAADPDLAEQLLEDVDEPLSDVEL